MEKLFAVYTNDYKESNEADRTLVHIITTDEVNRLRQQINPNGMDNENYQKNPIVLFDHGGGLFATSLPPIGRSLWQKVEGNVIKAKTEFANTPFGLDMFNLNKEGFLNAWSIGFMPKTKRYDEQNDIDLIDTWELLEYSSVTIPANPNAINVNSMLEVCSDKTVKEYLTRQYLEVEMRNALDEYDKKLKQIGEDVLNMRNDMESYQKKATEKIFDIANGLNNINKHLSKFLMNDLKNKFNG